MIQKLSKRPGKGFGGVLRYCLDPEKQPEIVAGNTTGETARSLTREFGDARAANEAVRKPVFHGSLSADLRDQVTTEQWRRIAETYVERMGYGECLWVAIRHRDTEHDHIHIIASRVRFDGRRVDDHQERKRGEAIVRQLERDHGLQPVAPSREAPRAAVTRDELGAFDRAGQVGVKARLQEHVAVAARGGPTMSEFAARLRAQGVGIRLHVASTGRVSGISFKLDGIALKGSDLGRGYSWRGLQERNGVTYDPERDLPILRAAEALAPQTAKDGPPTPPAPMPKHKRPAQVYRTAAVLASRLEIDQRSAELEKQRRAAGHRWHRAERALKARQRTERWLRGRQADAIEQAGRLYQESEAARTRLRELIASQGHQAAGRILETDPASLGRLQGAGIPWLRTEARKEAQAEAARLGAELRDIGRAYGRLEAESAAPEQAAATRTAADQRGAKLEEEAKRLPEPAQLRQEIAEAASQLGGDTVRAMRFSPTHVGTAIAALDSVRRVRRYLHSPEDDAEREDRGLLR